MSVIHDLKCWPEFFTAIADGSKTFEVRRDDRLFEVGDWLRLMEWDPTPERFTGRIQHVQVSYVLRNRLPWCAPGFAVLAIQRQAARVDPPASCSHDPDHGGAALPCSNCNGDGTISVMVLDKRWWTPCPRCYGSGAEP